MALLRFLAGWASWSLGASLVALLAAGPPLAAIAAFGRGLGLVESALVALAGWCAAAGVPGGMLSAWRARRQRQSRAAMTLEQAKRSLLEQARKELGEEARAAFARERAAAREVTEEPSDG